MDKYEVTNIQYRRFIQATGREAPQIWPGRYAQFTDLKISLDWQDRLLLRLLVMCHSERA